MRALAALPLALGLAACSSQPTDRPVATSAPFEAASAAPTSASAPPAASPSATFPPAQEPSLVGQRAAPPSASARPVARASASPSSSAAPAPTATPQPTPFVAYCDLAGTPGPLCTGGNAPAGTSSGCVAPDPYQPDSSRPLDPYADYVCHPGRMAAALAPATTFLCPDTHCPVNGVLPIGWVVKSYGYVEGIYTPAATPRYGRWVFVELGPRSNRTGVEGWIKCAGYDIDPATGLPVIVPSPFCS